MKVLCVGYRDWAISIYTELQKRMPKHTFTIVNSNSNFKKLDFAQVNPDLILFYGWSSIVPTPLLKKYNCVMLHPSKLPEYRGGSPIQNQIINGVIDSAVTLFLMNEQIDAGPILKQHPLSLKGNLKTILGNIAKIGCELTIEILEQGLQPKPQDHSRATYFNRRTPSQSEITVEEILEKPSSYLYNKLRMLDEPYPRPYIVTVDGKKIYISLVSMSE